MNHKTMIKSAAALGILLAALSSCTEQLAGPEADAREKKVQTIQGVICDAPGDGTRASIDGDTGAFSWVAGDVIAVYSSNGTYYDMPIQSGSGTDTGSFSAEFDGSLTGYAVYPYDIKDASASSASSVSVTLPDRYGFDNTRTDYEAYYKTYARMPMVARCANTCDFYHVGGLLRLSLQGVPANTSYLTVETDCPITGSFTVSNPSSTTPSISTTAGAGNPVHFNLTKVIASATNTITLNVPVPVGTYSRIKVSAYNVRHLWLGSAFNEVTRTVERAHGKKITMKFGDVTGTFAGLVLAPGNLCKNNSNANYYLYSNWDSFPNSNISQAFTWSSDLWSIFTKSRYGSAYDDKDAMLGSMDYPLGAKTYTWRLPTRDEWIAILGTFRPGSTVNNVSGWHFAYIQFESIFWGGGNSGRGGLLLFPDGVTMTPSFTLPYHNNFSVNTNVTREQLDEYLAAGCVFLPFFTGVTGTSLDVVAYRSVGYWSSTSIGANEASVVAIKPNEILFSKDSKKSNYWHVRLVREP